jgi:hypothetical protein
VSTDGFSDTHTQRRDNYSGSAAAALSEGESSPVLPFDASTPTVAAAVAAAQAAAAAQASALGLDDAPSPQSSLTSEELADDSSEVSAERRGGSSAEENW